MNKTRFIRSLLTVLGFVLSLKLALSLFLSLDEFTYTHAAWLVAAGKIPYRDFPLFHPPLLEFALAGVFLVTQSSLAGVLWSRALFGLLLFGTAQLVRRESKTSVGFVLTLCLGVFYSSMIEIRPDGLALFLFLLANFVLTKKHCLFSGLIISLSFFSSEKALVYAPALVVPLVLERNVKDLIKVVLSAMVCSSVAYGALLISAGLPPVREFLIDWAYDHETFYPPRSPWKDILIYLPQWSFLLCFSLVAIRKEFKANVQWIVLFFLGCLSYFTQRGPYGYSLLPALLALLVLASKGIQLLLARRVSNDRSVAVLSAIVLGVLIFSPSEQVTNQRQLNALALIDLSVPKSSCVYDNSGFAVTREHAGYWYFTDQLVRDRFMTQFEVAIPEEIERRQCVAMIEDLRFGRLSEKLQGKLKEIFPKCQGMVCWRGDFSFIEHQIGPK